jgi:hypothetical protein
LGFNFKSSLKVSLKIKWMLKIFSQTVQTPFT